MTLLRFEVRKRQISRLIQSEGQVELKLDSVPIAVLRNEFKSMR